MPERQLELPAEPGGGLPPPLQALEHHRGAAREQVEHPPRVDQVVEARRAGAGGAGVVGGCQRLAVTDQAERRMAQAGARERVVDVVQRQDVDERPARSPQVGRGSERGREEEPGVADAATQGGVCG
jgi:hypothetical protein